MRLTDLISEQRIKVPLECDNRDDAIKELLALVPLPSDEVRDEVWRAIQERERLMSTGIGNGIAIPHGMVPRPIGITSALGITQKPIDFHSIDGEPVHLIFLLVGDENDRGNDIKALARIARLLHREQFRQELLESRSPSDAMKTVETEESRHKI